MVKSSETERKERIKEQLRTRKYKPQPVRRVEIQKPDGGVRNLGVPTVTDRFVQQAIVQVLTPIYEGNSFMTTVMDSDRIDVHSKQS